MPVAPRIAPIPHLSIKGIKYLRCKYAPINTPVGFDRKLLALPPSVEHPPVAHKLSILPLNTLWWHIRCYYKDKPPVYVNRVRRRFREAFKAVLKERGYDIWGRSSVEGKESLVGSLELEFFSPSVLTEKFENLKSDADLLITELELQISKRHRNRDTNQGALGNFLRHKTRPVPSQESKTASPGEKDLVGSGKSLDPEKHFRKLNATTSPIASIAQSSREDQSESRIHQHRFYIPYRDLEKGSDK